MTLFSSLSSATTYENEDFYSFLCFVRHRSRVFGTKPNKLLFQFKNNPIEIVRIEPYYSFITLILIIFLKVKSQKTHQCKGHEITFSAEQVAGMKKCGDLVGVKSMEEMTPDKLPCFAKCMLESSTMVRYFTVYYKDH